MTMSNDDAGLLFPAPPATTAPISGMAQRFPVNRVFCVGRNYEAHAKEMGMTEARVAPMYFIKDASCIVESGATVPYPPGTSQYHHEIELVVALDKPAFRIDVSHALEVVFGYACGLDMTRRDLQALARDKGWPWDTGKNFEQSAILSKILPAAQTGHISSGSITLSVNGELKQSGDISDLIWSVPELIADLSRYYHLQPGDLIYTGTPAGIGPVLPGDTLVGKVAGAGEIVLHVGAAE
jgi:fumarylpyruvate hydrolase